jgi:hypothetical protein
MYGAPAAAAVPTGGGGGGSGGGGGVRHDIFVGNLAFNTTEDQLHQAFSEIGRVINVRLVTDMETGKPKGFAFIEYQDPCVFLCLAAGNWTHSQAVASIPASRTVYISI